MTTTSKLGFSRLVDGARHNLIRVNEALELIDALIGCRIATAELTDTPPLSPASGDAYIVGSSPTDEWADATEGQLAVWVTTRWVFIDLDTAGIPTLIDTNDGKLKIKEPGESNLVSIIPDYSVGSAQWTGQFTSDGRKIYRQKFTFSGLTDPGEETIEHSLDLDLDETYVEHMQIRNASSVKSTFGNGFSVYVDSAYVGLTSTDTPLGHTFHVWIRYALTA